MNNDKMTNSKLKKAEPLGDEGMVQPLASQTRVADEAIEQMARTIARRYRETFALLAKE